MRDVSLNTSYNVLLKSPRDRLAIQTLARQMKPGQCPFFMWSFDQATTEPHQYLFIDSKPQTPDILRLRSHIYPDETSVVYVPLQK